MSREIGQIITNGSQSSGSSKSYSSSNTSITLTNQTVTYDNISQVKGTSTSPLLVEDKSYLVTLRLQFDGDVTYRIVLLPNLEDTQSDMFYIMENNITKPSFTIKANKSYYRLLILPINGQTVNITSCNIKELNDIDLGEEDILKLGIQAKEGTLLCINGENIEMDSTCVYEIYNGYIVHSLSIGFKDNADSAIIDYVYEGGEDNV